MQIPFTRREALKVAGGMIGTIYLSACPDEGVQGDPFPNLNLLSPITVNGVLLGVWGEGDGARVWMVGGRVEEDGTSRRHIVLYERDAADGQGRIKLHWSAEGAPLWWIWGDSQGGIWAGGEEGVIVRLEGNEWVEEAVELDDEKREKAIIWGIWGDQSQEGKVWAVGGSYRRGGPRGLLLQREIDPTHPAGVVWRRWTDPQLPTERPDDPIAGLNLFKIWGEREGGAVWIVGEGGEALYWPDGIGGEVQRLDPPSSDLMFTVHGSQEGEERLAVGGYGQASAWRWRAGTWQSMALERGVTPLNGVSVQGSWAYLVGAMGVVTRCWLGDPTRYLNTQEMLRVSGAEIYTLHAVWSPESFESEKEQAPPFPIFIVGGDLESRREGVILVNLTHSPIVESWS